MDKLIDTARAVASLSTRELRVLVLLAIGYALINNGPAIVGALHLEAVYVPYITEIGRGAVYLAIGRVFMRALFPWLAMHRLYAEVVDENSTAAAIALCGAWLMLLGGIWAVVAIK